MNTQNAERERTKANHSFTSRNSVNLYIIFRVFKYVRGEGGHVIMNDGALLDVAKRKKEFFLSSFNRI